MPVIISSIDNVENTLLATVHGVWRAADFHEMLNTVEETKPDYVVVDPTHSIIPPGQRKSIENAGEERASVVHRIVQLLQDNPQMLYIMVNRNNTPILKTSLSLYENTGIADRYIFVQSLEEAEKIIANHQAKE